MRGGKYMSPHMRTPDSERRNKWAILHGIARALKNHVMNITEEPLPRALAAPSLARDGAMLAYCDAPGATAALSGSAQAPPYPLVAQRTQGKHHE
jgi:hypothetical protein